MEQILSGLGISGGAITIIIGVVYLLRHVFTSKCIKGDDGEYHLDLSLNKEDLKTIHTDPELKNLLLNLKQEINRRSINGSVASASPLQKAKVAPEIVIPK